MLAWILFGAGWLVRAFRVAFPFFHPFPVTLILPFQRALFSLPNSAYLVGSARWLLSYPTPSFPFFPSGSSVNRLSFQKHPECYPHASDRLATFPLVSTSVEALG